VTAKQETQQKQTAAYGALLAIRKHYPWRERPRGLATSLAGARGLSASEGKHYMSTGKHQPGNVAEPGGEIGAADAINPAPQRHEPYPFRRNPNPVFGYTQLNEAGKDRCNAIAFSFSALLDVLEHNCPPGREFSIVRTKLEEACMFAKKAVAHDPRYFGVEHFPDKGGFAGSGLAEERRTDIPGAGGAADPEVTKKTA
jgi:hypothetical protein